jgi:predicted metal-dependent phosphotriesterase family hydrolase
MVRSGAPPAGIDGDESDVRRGCRGVTRSDDARSVATVMTVRGPVAANQIGFTLPHEHLSCDPAQLHLREQAYNYSPTFQVIVDELSSYAAIGGSCVVDLTTSGQGRDAAWLRRLTAATEVHIVMGTGWYRQRFFPAGATIEQRSVDELAEELIAEIDHGLPTSGIRPGIVGEIGADEDLMSASEEKVHRAAALAARSTGLSLVTHSHRTRVALQQLRIFQEEGLDPRRVVIGHADTTPDALVAQWIEHRFPKPRERCAGHLRPR